MTITVFFKVFTSVLQARLCKLRVENKKIPQNQFGFVRNRSTINAVQALKTEVAARFKTHKQTYVCYVNFSKAFDRIVRNQLLEKLKNSGLSTKFHNVLSIILRISYLRICISDFVSGRIKQNRGLLQGDPLSPLLFILFTTDLALILSIFGCCFFYADDLAIVTDSTQQMTEALKKLEIYCRENHLTLNISKTKMMKIKKIGDIGRKDIVL